ncbi:transforming growth factor beta regulator 1 [Ordospora colligata]|uniref:FYR N-terminal domain-containing protein n=1 Tax=Ordospora colligata OC4 TaxID=1354746 RepID=A0A0B2UF48_9MICR|nr:uncharacterized protein M896_050930 [Ordospora colligata OC4]KHN69686.1 hypothetical protein M896_050930 [Ordospora colligata OC4]TBU15805.1 hypothetical protein CWI41_050920 [Ordospora colligata]TBU15933.1 hypothetical protein CWI40_050940 [Ordospora colligata]
MEVEDGRKEFSVQLKRFAEAMRTREMLLNEIHKATECLNVFEDHRNALVDVLRIFDGKMDVDGDACESRVRSGMQNMLEWKLMDVPDERCALVIFNLGKMPTPSMRSFYSQKWVYPIDYVCKRVYLRHGDRAEGLMVYKCVIRNVGSKPVFEVSDDEGMCISGKSGEVFVALKRLFPKGLEFESLNEFFGLGNVHVCKMLSMQKGFDELETGSKWVLDNSSMCASDLS